MDSIVESRKKEGESMKRHWYFIEQKSENEWEYAFGCIFLFACTISISLIVLGFL